MGHQALDNSIWENNESPKQDKLKHSRRFELKQQQKKKWADDEWDEWND